MFSRRNPDDNSVVNNTSTSPRSTQQRSNYLTPLELQNLMASAGLMSSYQFSSATEVAMSGVGLGSSMGLGQNLSEALMREIELQNNRASVDSQARVEMLSALLPNAGHPSNEEAALDNPVDNYVGSSSNHEGGELLVNDGINDNVSISSRRSSEMGRSVAGSKQRLIVGSDDERERKVLSSKDEERYGDSSSGSLSDHAVGMVSSTNHFSTVNAPSLVYSRGVSAESKRGNIANDPKNYENNSSFDELECSAPRINYNGFETDSPAFIDLNGSYTYVNGKENVKEVISQFNAVSIHFTMHHIFNCRRILFLFQ